MKVMKAYWEGMEVYWAGKKFEEGEHEAVLQVMEIKPSPFDENSSGWQTCTDRPLCYVTLRFEILDGSPGPADPCDYLECIECYPAPYSALDRMVKLVGGEEIPPSMEPFEAFSRMLSLPLGHRFRVRVETATDLGKDGDSLVDVYSSLVAEILGLAEPSQYGTYTLQAKDLT